MNYKNLGGVAGKVALIAICLYTVVFIFVYGQLFPKEGLAISERIVKKVYRCPTGLTRNAVVTDGQKQTDVIAVEPPIVNNTEEKEKTNDVPPTVKTEQLKVLPNTGTYGVNGIQCEGAKEMQKSDFPENNVVRQLPDPMLKNNPVPRPYPTCNLLSPWGMKNSSSTLGYTEQWLLILVKSAAQNLIRRNTIRETWASIRSIQGRQIFTVFVVAKTKSDIQTSLEKENKVFGDILQCDFEDSYKSLPMKVLSTMEWVLSNNVKSKFYMMTDDDVAIKVPNVFNFFMKEEAGKHYNEPRAYCGYVYSANNGVIRNAKSKWQIPFDVYPGNKYPPFCNGPNYSLTLPMINKLFCTATITEYTGFYLEDVLITGILRTKAFNGNQENILKTGGFIQYFWKQSGGVQNLIKQLWSKWEETELPLITLLKRNDTVVANVHDKIDTLMKLV